MTQWYVPKNFRHSLLIYIFKIDDSMCLNEVKGALHDRVREGSIAGDRDYLARNRSVDHSLGNQGEIETFSYLP